MIPRKYHIVLYLAGAGWQWSVENEEMNSERRGRASSYDDAARAALGAFDLLCKRDEAETA